MSAHGVTIRYPRENPSRAYARISLEDVRAANDLVIHFDFDRDGWVIESPTKFVWTDGEDSFEEGMEEVAFVPAFSERAAAALDAANGDPFIQARAALAKDPE
jgi:hypothetical protein